MKTKAFAKSRDERKRVEMRFAHLKTHHGFERMRLRGLSGARDEFHLAATHRMREIADHSVRVKVDAYRIASMATAGKSQSEDPNANQKTGFFHSIYSAMAGLPRAARALRYLNGEIIPLFTIPSY
jgi:Transposase DDE domain